MDNFMQPGGLQGGFDWYLSVHETRMAAVEGRASPPPMARPTRVLWGGRDPVLPAAWIALPDEVSDDAAASVLLRRVHPVQRGDWVLVQAAAGGVGQMLCRWAVHLGASVIGTVGRASQADLAVQAGCTRVLDSRHDDVAQCVRELTGGQGVAVAYDGVGCETFEASMQSLGLCGHLVNFGQSSGAVPAVELATLATRSLSLTRPIVFHHLRDAAVRAAMAQRVFTALRSGVLAVAAPRHFALGNAAHSHRVLEAEGAGRPLLLVP